MQSIEYRNFQFKGFNSVGACYVRTRITDDGKIVCLISQLRGYNGTSVTNVIEDIIHGVVERLFAEGVLPKALSTMDKILKRSVWIEHYPPGVGMSPSGSWAVVTLDAEGKPDWEHVTLDDAIALSGVEANFFSLSAQDVQFKN
ncbi:hypothetical protein SAMN05216593_109188 [Pseudomonas asturiensis]|uniref:Uncharacterized protein n=1 Tax=Pseudomonas asturiensis TaxID=1190415 RepID=A0A1M7PC31_9PSED|nr:hypothetical protein [Pseudomonas asturiensis]SHN14408.1 hypothetical protein SAMN05216593_109188 [Pseudomonas asturiensis]